MKQFIYYILKFTKHVIFKTVSLIVLLCLAASFFIFSDFYKKQWHKVQSYYYVYLGDKAYKENHPQDAINNYTIALELHPKHVRARYNLANLYVAYEDYLSALENYEETLRLKPDFTAARIDYAIILSEIALNYDKAIEQYELAVANKPKGVYIPFISDTKKTYKYNKAAAYYNQGLAWREKSILYAGDKFASRKYLQNAIESYEKSLDDAVGYDVYYNLGIANHLLGRNKSAVKNYCLAIKEEPEKYEAHYNLGVLLKSMKKYKEAMDEFKKASLLIGSSDNAIGSQFLFNAISTTNMEIAKEKDSDKIFESINNDNISKEVKVVNKKLVISKEFEKALNESFKNCPYEKELFKEGQIEI